MREGSTDFDVFAYGNLLGRVTLGVPGKHNVLNGLAVIALATELGVDFSDISGAMREFRGAKRRFDVLYRSANYSVVDDYGHHPTEIKATIATAKHLNPERLVCVFQPHRYTRTQLMMDEFAKAFREVDELFVTDIYPAGEKPIENINSEAVVKAIHDEGRQKVSYVPDVKTAHLEVGADLSCGDTILTLGAGNIHEVGAALARDLEILDKLRRELDDPETKCKLYEPMSRHTTIKVGGPAQYWVEPVSIEAFAKSLKFFCSKGIKVRVVGRGSNLLICDGGIPGAVIRPSGGEFEEVRVSENIVTAGVGARYKKVSNIAKANGISGFEWMEGIPGNVGGGLRMNAGAMGFETFDQVLSIKYLDSEGELHEKMAEDFDSKYRNVPKLNENYAVSAVLKGTKDDAEMIDGRIRESMEKRKRTQPIAASAGCIFKNPIDISAGQLIEELGLKNSNVGAARVSDVHGNFIVNDGGARAKDVIALIDEIKIKAKTKRSIELETEVQIIGQEKLKF
jgi:UDP-N-acetylenolpyruvoylglucosamine reductase